MNKKDRSPVIVEEAEEKIEGEKEEAPKGPTIIIDEARQDV